MKIAVTGGNGELGRNLIPYLVEKGHDVINLDRNLPREPWLENLPVKSMVVDTCNFGDFVECLRGCDALIHLAAIRDPDHNPDTVIYTNNTISSYNALNAASILGIKRICLASSINAIGGSFSQRPRYDYFPLDENHPNYSEDSYSLSKWVLEQQANSFARRFNWMNIISLRFHWLVENRAIAERVTPQLGELAIRNLWGYTSLHEASRACLISITIDAIPAGHEVFYIVAPHTATNIPSTKLANLYYFSTILHSDLIGNQGFYDCHKAERLLGWLHES